MKTLWTIKAIETYPIVFLVELPFEPALVFPKQTLGSQESLEDCCSRAINQIHG